MNLDGPDGLAKGWTLSNSDMSFVKRRQQRGSSVMICDGIVDQTIIGPFKVKLYCANYCPFMDKTFFAWYN